MLFRSICTPGVVSNALRRLTSPSIRNKSLAYFSSSASVHSKLTAEQVIVRAPAKYEVPELNEVSSCASRNQIKSSPASHICVLTPPTHTPTRPSDPHS